ncbi:SRPBCC domain-containing protein [Ciceribacter sp. L1K23]|uniref:SRPBCC domain-containing protein n=1 Tax=Ciceribacter sp. L1K23 TaxID=2820276 RepID=UPI001B83C8AB|nr:SRPBCC domain-containing protein [Ciceribacter sp. L1K23]MBR0554968.1 SRPBCC domain-containing protein [Ciceribacter sp. L1K23]
MTDKIEILNDRLFPVSRQTLFDAFADPKTLEIWWGPDGFTNRITAFDLRPGGDWLVTMIASNGDEFHNHWSFEEVVAGERIRAFHHGPVHAFPLEMTFVEEPDGTRLSWRMLFERTEENLEIERFLHAANEQNFDRLQVVLEKGAN